MTCNIGWNIHLLPREIALASPEVTILTDDWLGSNVIILPEVIIGNGTIIGAGSVVN